ncbi:DUF2381 family protein [Corallococcus exiguus]|uniref:DUF2381 family protein n=1 Tax=Corallococcus exiguus TaxID=83462 RepID=A0A7X5BV02_9BACT|nr:DUF2381 family protein [Corallococcus exiguus]NBC44925.1 DUF2381 family protein [Corallococcus exiguus]TNV62689.1 DUF2381 family protein [Corallococcus exiguus]
MPFSFSALNLPLVLGGLLLFTAAQAQSASAVRERRDRRVVLPRPGEPVLEVPVAAGILTTLVLDSALDRASVDLEGRTRFKLVDVGERAINLEPVMELGAGEHLMLRVRFADGSFPEHAVFALVSHPAVVDTRVEVSRRPLAPEALQAELSEVRAQLAAKEAELAALRARGDASSPAALTLAGLFDEYGVSARKVDGQPKKEMQSSLYIVDGFSLRASAWGVVSVEVKNYGKTPWTPTEARLTRSTGGVTVQVLGVHMKQPRIGPGEVGTVVVETEETAWERGTLLRLELVDSTGTRPLLVPSVAL